MNVHVTSRETPIPAAVVVLTLVGGLVALAGGLWDDVWHTERGRDSFFIAPHITIYSGVTLVGWALSGWLLVAARRLGLSAVRRQGSLLLAVLAVVVTLASAPVDNLWHIAFGRDAVIWSPPHLLGIVGTGALAIAVLVALGNHPQGWRSHARWVAAGAALAAFAFVTVEYDTDVPQFPLFWHLPVLATGAAFVLGLVRRATGDSAAATKAAAAHFVFLVLTSLFLMTQGFDAPRLPLLVFPALALDLAARRRNSTGAAASFVVALFSVYGFAAEVAWSGQDYRPFELIAGALVAWPAVALVLAATGGTDGKLMPPRRGAAAATVNVLLVALILPVAARAHDPGQGEEAGAIEVVMRSGGDRITVTATLPPDTIGERLVARRAGEVVSVPVRTSGRTVRAELQVPSIGRWFVYLEMARNGRRVESWLPVEVGEGPEVVEDASRFAYFVERESASALQIVASVVMFALVLAFLVAVVILVRRTAPRLERAVPPGPLS